MDFDKGLYPIEIRQAPEDDKDNEKYGYFRAIISSTSIDGHYTRMTMKTLRNFTRDLKKGTQVKDSHGRGQGFGVSTDGELDDEKVYGDFKLVKGFELRNASYPRSDEFIRAIDEGIITEVSVGFGGGEMRCSICKLDLWSRDCRHWPGEKYEQTVDGKKQMVTAYADIDDARLKEVSLVDVGSNPDAKIVQRAQRHYAEGILPPAIQRQLEEKYENVRFDPELTPKSKTKTNKEVRTMDLEKALQQLEAANVTIGERDAKISELESLAECGKQARASVSAEVVEAFKIKNGESVTEDQIRQVEERNNTLTYSQLVVERNWLVSQAPEKPDVKSGSSTSQPDNSGARDQGSKQEIIIPRRYERFAMLEKKL